MVYYIIGVDYNDKLRGLDRRFFSRLFIFYAHPVSSDTFFKYDDISRRTCLYGVPRIGVCNIID